MPSGNGKKKNELLGYVISALVVIALISAALAIFRQQNFFLMFLLFAVLYVVMFISAALIRKTFGSGKKQKKQNGIKSSAPKKSSVKYSDEKTESVDNDITDSSDFRYSYPKVEENRPLFFTETRKTEPEQERKYTIPDASFTFEKKQEETRREREVRSETIHLSQVKREEKPEIKEETGWNKQPVRQPEAKAEEKTESKTEARTEQVSEAPKTQNVLAERKKVQEEKEERYEFKGDLNIIRPVSEIESDTTDLSASIDETLKNRPQRHFHPVVTERKENRPRLFDSSDIEENSDSYDEEEEFDVSDSQEEVADDKYADEPDEPEQLSFDTDEEISEEQDEITEQETEEDQDIEFPEPVYEIKRNSRTDDGMKTDSVSADREKINRLFGRDTGKDKSKTGGVFSGMAKKNEPEKKSEQVKTVRRVAYTVPSVDILRDHPSDNRKNYEKEEQLIKTNEEKLISVLASFGISAKIINSKRGPSVTRYELQPEPGVKVSRILSLADDIALSLASAGIRFEAPIPGKSAIGIEVPNKETDLVFFKEIIQSPEYQSAPSKISVALGKDISGNAIVGDIGKFPHLLIAGATGSGKSVCINTIIASILFKARPDEVRFIMIDPKVVELGVYNGIPHLLIPVVTDPKKAASALSWAVQEVENRYALFAENRVRDLKGFNQQNPKNKMYQIVIIIDELADLMMTSSKEVEDCIIRLAQKARAAGVHLVIATQRPSVDVITGLIKANIPSRIAFAVTSYIDSRTILDSAGAEKLLGHGDMLYHPIGMIKPKRVQGAFISDDEVETTVKAIRESCGEVEYNQDIIRQLERATQEKHETADGEEDVNQDIDLIIKAGDIGVEFGQMSTSFLQRKLKIGFSRASRVIDVLEEKGIVSHPDGSKPRTILVSKEEWESIKETL